MKKAVQQFMLGSVLKNEASVKNTLFAMKEAGYDSIELCSFMLHPMGLVIRLLTKAAGMPVGSGGSLDWNRLIDESGLNVISLHADLGSIEKDSHAICEEAKSFHTDTVVITGMYRFNYGDEETMHTLAKRLNEAGKNLKKEGIRLLYHNHNCELRKVNDTQCAYDILLEETDPSFVNFEFDSYWFTEGGADAKLWMNRLGNRMKLWHINDRGSRVSGSVITPILKTDSMELGTGNMDLVGLKNIAEGNGVEGVILESHKNWIDNDPVKSLILSAKWLSKNI
ncbi:MAG: sugar phosphate isomerase/epimerase [Lachnospiraceae bacterium]|nr:sugar phosphate isomerase/epimerase [Lachnospiraceae bacterium]